MECYDSIGCPEVLDSLRAEVERLKALIVKADVGFTAQCEPSWRCHTCPLSECAADQHERARKSIKDEAAKARKEAGDK